MNDAEASRGYTELPFAHGGPVLAGQLRTEPADFRVEEILGFAADGAGEHVLLEVEKTGANTAWVAAELARFAGVGEVAVGWSGLKDRHAVTRQCFSLHLPGRPDPDWNTLAIPGVRVLAAARHGRKLKRGAHHANRFRIRLRAVAGDASAAEARLARIAAQGVPNYFGEQRFGRGGQNLRLAARLFAGARLKRQDRSHALSAARSALFNAVLAERVRAGSWSGGMDGEVWMLAGAHSIFGPLPLDAELAARADAQDIHPTAPLWGRGELRSGGGARALEQAVADAHAAWCVGLAAAGLVQERRTTRLLPRELAWEWEDATTLVLGFELERGAFATSLLRELCTWHDGGDGA